MKNVFLFTFLTITSVALLYASHTGAGGILSKESSREGEDRDDKATAWYVVVEYESIEYGLGFVIQTQVIRCPGPGFSTCPKG